MASLDAYVGLDYHSGSVQVCAVDRDGKIILNRKCENDLLTVVSAVPAGYTVRAAAIESCCGAADFAEALREGPRWPVTLAHPGYVNRMKHNPEKSDYSDAKMLAELSRAGFVPAVWLAPAAIRDLRTLVRLRADVVARVRAVKTRILGVLRAHRIKEPAEWSRWTKKWLGWLDGEVALATGARFVVDEHLAELREHRARLARVEAKLTEQTAEDRVVVSLLEKDGIGKVTAWTMRAMIGDFGRFASGKQLSRFCAVTPRNASSGERVADAGLVRAGDPLLKSVLIEGAHRLRRLDKRWGEFSERLKAKGKPTGVIVAAIANRWVRKLYHEIKSLDQGATAA